MMLINGWMVSEYELERMLKEVVTALLTDHLPEETEEHQRKPGP
jgi:hypothetical protein